MKKTLQKLFEWIYNEFKEFISTLGWIGKFSAKICLWFIFIIIILMIINLIIGPQEALTAAEMAEVDKLLGSP